MHTGVGVKLALCSQESKTRGYRTGTTCINWHLTWGGALSSMEQGQAVQKGCEDASGHLFQPFVRYLHTRARCHVIVVCVTGQGRLTEYKHAAAGLAVGQLNGAETLGGKVGIATTRCDAVEVER